MSESLLPPNATPQEKALELAASARLDALPVGTHLWSADNCPAAFLPWLAFALSVDEWKSDWTGAEKRAAIRASFEIHQTKGTLGAVSRALAAHGFTAEFSEWFQYGGAPFTFRIGVDLGGRPAPVWPGNEIRDLVEGAKNARSFLSKITVTNSAGGPLYMAAFPEFLATYEVLPNPPVYPEQSAAFYMGASVNFLFDYTVNP